MKMRTLTYVVAGALVIAIAGSFAALEKFPFSQSGAEKPSAAVQELQEALEEYARRKIVPKSVNTFIIRPDGTIIDD